MMDGPLRLEVDASPEPDRGVAMTDITADLARLRQSTEHLEQAMGSPLTELRTLLEMPFMRGELSQRAETTLKAASPFFRTQSIGLDLPPAMQTLSSASSIPLRSASGAASPLELAREHEAVAGLRDMEERAAPLISVEARRTPS